MSSEDQNIKSQSLFTQDGYEVPIFDKHYKNYLNRSIVLYGASASGKSMIMRDILYTLKDHIPNMCVICPTNNLNKSYDGIIPSQLIYNEVTEDLIKKIFNRQKVAVKMYNMTNDLDRLKHIYNKLSRKNNEKLMSLIASYNKIKHIFSNNDNIHISEKKIKLQELDEEHNKSLIAFYKEIISKNKSIIDRNNNLDENEIRIINYININPNFLIIIDDAAVSASVWSRYQEVKELFFNGRHHKITFMISFQDDKLLESSLRKNAFINIFTTQVTCNSFFERTANNFTKAEKNKMAKLSHFIFNDEKLKNKNYKKLVYIKDRNPTTYYIIANYYDDFQFGSKHLYELCDKVKKNDDKNEEDYEFSSFF
jgi:hypothetical protein